MTSVQFNHYYESNISALTNFAKKLTRNDEDAKDLVQETAIKAFRGMSSFKQGSNFKSWAFTILKNTFITKYNKKKKRGVVNAPIEDFTYALESTHSINNDAISIMRIKEIENCIERLSSKSSTPFLMYIKGFKYDEIADHLDIPVGTVKSRINFARKKIKSYMSEIGMLAF